MANKTSVCEELSVKAYLDILDDNDILKEKIEKLGIVLDENGLSVPLNYSDLLTEEEKSFLKKLSDEFNVKYEGDTIWYFKFGDLPLERRICESDVICENCYKSLMKVRNHEDYMKTY